MIKRDLYKHLISWKKDKSRMPLLIRGARQVGKSYLIEKFGKNEFKNFVVINFERNPEYKSIFNFYDPKEIIKKLMILSNSPIQEGDTLLFFDEIQECPNAITSLRYFYEELPKQHIICAGSLLEFALKSKDFKMPVGRVQYLFMNQVSFKEFICAINRTGISEILSDVTLLKNIDDTIHNKLNELLKIYLILGGMPAVLSEYIETANINKCVQIQSSIVNTFIDDFGKYSKKVDNLLLQKVFYSSTNFIGQKFKYSNVDNEVKTRYLKEAVMLLEMAGLITRVRRSNGDGYPLESNVKDNFFKTIFLDVGLLHNIHGDFKQTVLDSDLSAAFRGNIAEQYVGQEILNYFDYSKRPKLYYWMREAKNSSAEVDYLYEFEGKILPIEVKAGNSAHLKSLMIYLNKYNPKMAVRFSPNKLDLKNSIISIPLYATSTYFNNPNSFL